MRNCSMLAAGLSLGPGVGLGLPELTSTLVAALNVASKKMLAGFDALSASLRLRLNRMNSVDGSLEES